MKKSVGAVICFKDKYLIQKKVIKKYLLSKFVLGFGGTVEKKKKLLKP